jgi:hypothetical protein
MATLLLAGCGLVDAAPKPSNKPLSPSGLKAELLTAPIGSKPFGRAPLAPDGILAVDQYVEGEFAPQGRAYERINLAQLGFAYAVEANWTAADGVEADDFLIKFGEADLAEAFVTAQSQDMSQQVEPEEPLSPLPGVPGGEVWSGGALDYAGNIREVAWFTVDDIAVELHVYAPGRANPGEVDQLARAQYARLAGHVTTPSPLPSPAASAPAPQGATAVGETPADRRRLQGDLVTPPKGSQPWADNSSNGPTGVLPLQQFAARFVMPSDNQRIIDEENDRGFQYAVREDWRGVDGSQANVYLLKFGSATGAQSFALESQSGARSAVGTAGTYAIPGSGDAMAYQYPGPESDGNVRTETYAVVGDIAVVIDVWVPAQADRAEVQALVKEQYAKLLADPTVAAAAKAAPPLPSP